MISAVTEACSVRYAQVDCKIYKFQSLVFKEGKFFYFTILTEPILIPDKTRTELTTKEQERALK